MMPYALPPAETRLSIHAIAGGLLENSSDFAGALRNYLGADTCVAADSARALLYLLFCCLRTRAGNDKNEVLIPGYTCYTVPAAVVKAGLKVALYDMDPDTFQPDLKDAERKISPHTLAVVGQHLLGVKSDISGLAETARKNGIYCIEDAAQLLETPGKESQDEFRADFTLFSFGRGKPLPLGRGGALTAAGHKELSAVSGELEKRVQKPGNFLLPVGLRIFSSPRLYWILEKLPLGLGKTVYDPYFSVGKMPALYRRIGIRAIKELREINNHRAAICRIYGEILSGKSNTWQKAPVSPCVRYPLLVKNQGDVSELFGDGARRLYPLALCDLPPLQGSIRDRASRTPGAREIAGRLVTLPTHLAVTRGAALEIAGRAKKTFKEIRTVKQ